MKLVWFKRAGIIFIPISLAGAVLYILTLGFCMTVILAANRNSHSVTDFLYGIFPYLVSAFTILFWIAANTCNNKSE
jgi:hypothetical protein